MGYNLFAILKYWSNFLNVYVSNEILQILSLIKLEFHSHFRKICWPSRSSINDVFQVLSFAITNCMREIYEFRSEIDFILFYSISNYS